MATTKTDVEVEDPQIKRLVRIYLKMKTRRDEISSAFKAEEAKLEEQMTVVKDALLEYCKTNGVEGARTTEGLFYRTVNSRYSTNDWSELGKFVVANNVPDLYEKRLNQGNVKQFLEEHPDKVLPGLVVDSKYTINIRRK